MKRFFLVFTFVLFLSVPLNAGWYYGGNVDFTADANCMGAWYMNGGLSANGDDETDRSGEGETLTESGGDIPNSATVPTNYSGNSRDFESGDTEWLEHADGGSTDISGANQPITITAWIKPEDDTGAAMYIVSKHDDVNGSRQYALIYSDAGSAFKCYLSNDGNSSTAATGATDISYGAWQHIACVYNDTDIRIYVNGSLDSNGADNPKAYTDGIFDGNEAFRIGAEDTALYYDGLIDEVGVFDRGLSASEILRIYNKGLSGNRGGSD